MRFLELESNRAAYRADFAVYGLAVSALGAALLAGAPGPAWPLLALVAAGGLLWSLLEYLLHRFVLHGMAPFRGMHGQHHLRPQARIGTPTVVSAPLFTVLVFVPAWALAGRWPACALTLGMLGGYLTYATTHHLCHHGHNSSAWSARRRLWHGRHHAGGGTPGCYGVSHGVWDHVFGTARTPRMPRPARRHVGRTYRRLG